MILDERALRLPAGAHRADQIARIEPDARGQIVDQPFGGGQLFGVTGPARVDHHAEVLQAGHAPAQLADRDNAGGVARQQFLDLAAQVPVELRRPPRRRDRQQHRHHPQSLAVTEGPRDETAGGGTGTRLIERHEGR